MMTIRPFLLLLVALSALPSLAQNQTGLPQAAVLAFTGDETLQATQLSAYTRKFQGELIKQNRYRFVEREQLDAILQEQGLQASGVCDNAGCQVQLGRLLSVEKLFVGSVARFDDLYVLQVSRLDVQSGAVDKSWTTKVRGTAGDVLENGCPMAARQVLATELGVPFATDTLVVGNEWLRNDSAARQAARQSQVSENGQKRLRWVRAGLLTLGAVAVGTGLVGGIYNNRRSNDAYDDYSELSGITPAAQDAIDASWDKVDTYEKKRDRFYALSGLGAVVLVGTWVLF